MLVDSNRSNLCLTSCLSEAKVKKHFFSFLSDGLFCSCRTLSPPLSSPRPPAHQPALSFAPDPHQDLPGPSQLPSQLPQLQHQIPSSQATNNKTMVDCGCDPIVFSEDSESEQEQEDEGLDNKSQRGKGVQISKGVKRHAARYAFQSVWIA